VLAYDVEKLNLKYVLSSFTYRPAVSVVVYIDILPAYFIRNLHGIMTKSFKHIINN